MSLAKGRVNPLNVLDLRKLDRIPPNFAKIKIKEHTRIKEIDHWIYTNLDSRYCIRKVQSVDSYSNKLITVYEIGVEDPKELSMLSLACPYLHK
jgi:hypothetical protein